MLLEARGLKGLLESKGTQATKAYRELRAREERQGYKGIQEGSGRRANRAKRGLKDQSV